MIVPARFGWGGCRCLVALLFVLAGGSSTRAARVPAWLTQAAARPTDACGPEVGWIVLDDRGEYNASRPGRITRTVRHAVRILTRDGIKRAVARSVYYAGASKLVSFKAWLIDPQGKVKTFGRSDVVDRAADEDALFSERRYAVISAVGEAEVGSVFGWEVVEDRRTDIGELCWRFQSEVPVLHSSLTVLVGTATRAEGRLFNHAPIAPAVTGNATTWELRDLPAFPNEPMSPSMERLGVKLSVKLLAPARADGRPAWLAFPTWDELVHYASGLHEASIAPTAELQARVAELTQGCASRLAKIRAIADFAQKTRYVAIAVDLEHGGGFQPRPAAEVLRCGYGDCKDKTTLMRAMLRIAGIESYPVAASWGDRSAVAADWPALGQFNHCIIAVRVDDEFSAAGVVPVPGLGHLLFFDPTDTCTAFGDLDYSHQGSTVLVLAPVGGRLVELPHASPDANRMERTVEAELRADGSLIAQMSEHSRGQEAVRERRPFRSRDRNDYERAVRAWIGRGIPVSTVREIEPADQMENGRFDLRVAFAAPQYARSMRGQLLVFKPVMIERHDVMALGSGERRLPLVLEPRTFHEEIRVILPEGFAVDQLPAPVRLTTDFGRYDMATRVEGNVLHLERDLHFEGREVPPTQFAEVRSFLEHIVKTEQTPIVLERQ